MFSARAKERLKFYVYRLLDPRTNRTFYVGKGKGNRCYSHLKAASDSEKAAIVRELARFGLTPRIEILKHGLTEAEALLVEATTIDLLGLEKLTNLVHGQGHRHGTGGSVEIIAAELDAKPVTIKEPAILININRNFRAGMTLQAMYDATRAAWKVGPKRDRAKYALSVYQGIVREVFWIAKWLPAGSTMRARDLDGRPQHSDGRSEFVGRVAEDKIRRKYLNRSVSHYLKPGAQNPVMYVNC